MSNLPTVREILQLQENEKNKDDIDFRINTKRLLGEFDNQRDEFLQRVYTFMREKKCKGRMYFSLHLHHTDYCHTDIIDWIRETLQHVKDEGFHVRFAEGSRVNRCEAVLTDAGVNPNPINHYSMNFELQITCEQPLNDGKHYYIL